MAPRVVKNLTNMEIDEISLVDRGANEHATVAIAKRAPEEETMPKLYDEEGILLDEEALEDGQIVYDDEGAAYEFTLDEDESEEDEVEVEAEEKELAPVGKRFEFGKKAKASDFSKSVLEQLSKAYSDEDRDKVLSKAFDRVAELEAAQKEATEIAKSERDLRLTREYISKAAEYNLPVDANDLGPVLYRMAEQMDYNDCAVIHKCLESAGAILFEELGYQGGGDNNDVMDQVNARAVEIGKSADAENVTGVFDENPLAYDEYLAQRGR